MSELVGLKWGDVIAREKQVQLSVFGKGGLVRQVLLPSPASRNLLALRGDAGANDPVFASKTGTRLTERGRALCRQAGSSAGGHQRGCLAPLAAPGRATAFDPIKNRAAAVVGNRPAPALPTCPFNGEAG